MDKNWWLYDHVSYRINSKWFETQIEDVYASLKFVFWNAPHTYHNRPPFWRSKERVSIIFNHDKRFLSTDRGI